MSAFLRRDRGERGMIRVVSTRPPGDPRERTVAIVSLGMGILMTHMGTIMDNISTGEYGSQLGHAK